MNLCCCFIFGVRRPDAALTRLLNVSVPRAVSSGITMESSHDPVATAPGCDTSSLHRIVTARTKWLTPQQAPDGHAAAPQRAMAFNRFARVFRASRNKTARRRQPRRDYCFVKLQKRNQNRAHRSPGALAQARARLFLSLSNLSPPSRSG